MEDTLILSVESIEFSEALYLKNVKDPTHDIKNECGKGEDQ